MADKSLLEVVDKFNGCEPGSGDTESGNEFLPVTRRDRYICGLLVAVIIVASYTSLTGIEALLTGSESETAANEPVAVAVQEDGNGNGAEVDETEVTGQNEEGDGSIELDFGDARLRYDEKAGGEVVELPEVLRELYAVDGEDAVGEPHGGGDTGSRGTLAAWNGRDVFEKAGYSGQRGKAKLSIEDGFLFDDEGQRKSSGRAYEDLRRGYGQLCDADALELPDYRSSSAYSLSTGVYRFSSSQPDLKHRAAWYGGVGVKAFSWLQTKVATSTVGKKLQKAGITGMMALSLGIGGYDVAVTEYNAIEAEQAVMVEEMASTMANRAIMADAGEEIYVLAERIAYNNANNISMSASETVMAACEDFEAACTTGVLPTAANSTLEGAILDAITKGCYSVEALQPLAAMGESLINFFNLENPEAAVTLKTYEDAPIADKIIGTIQAQPGTYVYGDKIKVTRTSVFPGVGNDKVNQGNWSVCTVNSSGNVEQAYSVANAPEIYIYDAQGYGNRIFVASEGEIVTASGSSWSYSKVSNWLTTNNSYTFYVNTDVILNVGHVPGGSPVSSYIDSGNYSRLEVTSMEPSGEEQPVEGDAGNVYDSGYRLIGNDAEFDEDGNLVNSGTVNYVDPADHYTPDDNIEYPGDADYGYGSYEDLLDDADVSPVKPADPVGEVTESDPIWDPANPEENPEPGEGTGDPEGQEPTTIGDKVGNPTPKPSRLRTDVSIAMDDLAGRVENKFPFSVPANVTKAISSLKASPEAPHFTWVFELPTGREEYEVTLEEFSPVAHVLRLTLDVLLVFMVISLLGKIAQVWGFIDKAVD